MSASQALVADDILGSYPLSRHRCLLDVGGGDGSFALRAAQKVGRLQVICFDLPAVIDCARARIANSGLGARVSAVAGDFFKDPLPRGADVLSLVRVLHDHDDDAAARILAAARAALPSDGTLLLAEPLSGTPGGQRAADAYFGFYLLAMGSGKPRSVRGLDALLKEAGFTSSRLRTTHLPMNVRVLVARCAERKSVKTH
jgi:demethylspheroidene O-methyltransferase